VDTIVLSEAEVHEDDNSVVLPRLPVLLFLTKRCRTACIDLLQEFGLAHVEAGPMIFTVLRAATSSADTSLETAMQPYTWRVSMRSPVFDEPVVVSHVYPLHYLWRHTRNDQSAVVSDTDALLSDLESMFRYIVSFDDVGRVQAELLIESLRDDFEVFESLQDMLLRSVLPCKHVIECAQRSHREYSRWSWRRGVMRLGMTL
jgi:hypothetical protein